MLNLTRSAIFSIVDCYLIGNLLALREGDALWLGVS